ncbi:MAG: penicillin-binding transpeptidase domain-containing protein [Pseudomonadota bacterium]
MRNAIVPVRLYAVAFALFAVLASNRALSDSLTVLDAADWQRALGERQMIFYALDLETDRAVQFAPERLDERYRPFSTFKIPNLLIALEMGVERNLDSRRTWDPARRPAQPFWPSAWAEDQTLRSAFRRSAVWYFREIALDVGGPSYRDWLNRFDYGNAAAPDANDQFWLVGPLAISVREQVQFLQRLLTDQLSIQAPSLAALKEASGLDQRQDLILHGKTGSGPVTDDMDGAFQGWLVGWVERSEQRPVIFALFVEGPSFSSIRTFRLDMSRRLLIEAGFWPS